MRICVCAERGYEAGLISKEQMKWLEQKEQMITQEMDRLKKL